MRPPRSHLHTSVPVSRAVKFSPVLVAIAALALPSAAFGQATRTWVSGVGDDVNPCSRTAPCKTFAGAISKTATGGEINVLDPGGFGAVTITKSITIDAENTEAGVLGGAAPGIVVNAGATGKVNLRGLDINGVGMGTQGVRVISAKRVRLINSKIYNFTQHGFDFEPTTPNAKGLVQGSTIYDNAGMGVLVAPPSAGAGARVTVRDSVVSDNACGIVATNIPGGSFATDCGTGAGSGGAANVNVYDSSIIDNDLTAGGAGSVGVFTSGSSALAQISGNTITGNNFGIRAAAAGATGGIFSFSNNVISGNGTDGSPTGTRTLAKRVAKRR